MRFICDECKKKCRKTRKTDGQCLCYKCYIKRFHKIGLGISKKMTLNEALNKEYKLGYQINNKGYVFAVKHFPEILAGRTVKLVLIK